jgi:hypothetical protein
MREKVFARLPEDLVAEVERFRKVMGPDATLTAAIEELVRRGLRRRTRRSPESVTRQLNASLAESQAGASISPQLMAAQVAMMRGNR